MCATMIIFGIILILGENINHFVFISSGFSKDKTLTVSPIITPTKGQTPPYKKLEIIPTDKSHL